ncbi:MAG: hypothetical protein DCC71_15560, partial [Proteobacteria bacterium]
MQLVRAAWILAAAGALLAGCAPKQQGLPNAPIFNTGARATIISPSQQAPVMPGSRAPGQGSYSSSSRGIPGQAGPSGYLGQGGGAPPPGTPPSQYGSPYGNPNDISMLGGAVTVDTREVKKPRNVLRDNPIFWPFLIVAWPFEKIAEAVDGDDEQQTFDQRAQQIVESGGAPSYYGGNARQQSQIDRERAENEAMERELAERGAGAAPASGASAAAPAAGGT